MNIEEIKLKRLLLRDRYRDTISYNLLSRKFLKRILDEYDQIIVEIIKEIEKEKDQKDG